MDTTRAIIKSENTNNKEWLEYAVKYLQYGFSIIPIGPNKQPLLSWKEYQSRKPTTKELEGWSNLDNLRGLAVVTGKISGVFVLDVDEGGKVEDLPQTPIVRTGSGIHYFFKYPENIDIKNTTGFRPKVDIRGEGGYAILPPTIHPNGKEYKWLLDLNTPIAQSSEWLLNELTNRDGNSGPLPTQVYEGVGEGHRNTAATHIIGILLANLPPKYWENVVWPLITAWNERNNPPLEEKELTVIYKSISSRELSESSKSHSIYSSDDLTDDISFFTIKDLLESETAETSWLVDQLIPEYGITCLAAKPKTGKSYLSLQIAQSVAQGSDLFGRFKVKKSGVLIINKEDIKGTIKERLNNLKAGKDLPIVLSTDQRIFFHTTKYLNKILDQTKRYHLDLVIIDSFRRFFKGDENSSMEIRPLHHFFKLLNQNGLTVLFIHHHGKGLEGRNDGDKLRGSSDILAIVDSLISLERTNNKRFLKLSQSELRQRLPHAPFVISMPTFQDNDYQYKYLNSLEEEKNATVKAQEDVFNLLKQVPGEFTQTEIITNLTAKQPAEYGTTTIKNALAELEETKQLIVRPENTRKYYSLSKNQSSQSHPINTTDRVTNALDHKGPFED